MYEDFVVFHCLLMSDFIVILGIILKLQRDVKFQIFNHINLIVLFCVPIVRLSLIISIPTSFNHVVVIAYAKMNNGKHIFVQLEQFVFII